MRIGLFTYGVHGERMTGIARYAVELSRALKRVDSAVEILLLNPYPRSDHPWYREFRSIPLPHLAMLPLAATLGNMELHRAAVRLGLDVLHDPCGIAPFLARGGSYARVTTVHDAVPVLYPRTQPLLTRLVFATLVRQAGRTSDAILTVSQASKRDLVTKLNLPTDKVHVAYNGVRPDRRLADAAVQAVLERRRIEQPYFLYVGALHPRKNLRRATQAFLHVRQHHPQCRLAIVGPPSWGADDVLHDVLDSARSAQGIVFTGFVSDEELQALYQGAVALVFPSLYEGFGLPALEAMSHGTAVITSDTSSLPEVVGDAGLLVDPASVDAIAGAMRLMLDDPALRETLATRGQERSRAFTWDATARTTLDVYRGLRSSRRQHA